MSLPVRTGSFIVGPQRLPVVAVGLAVRTVKLGARGGPRSARTTKLTDVDREPEGEDG